MPYLDNPLKTHPIYRLYSNSTCALNNKSGRVPFMQSHLAQKGSRNWSMNLEEVHNMLFSLSPSRRSRFHILVHSNNTKSFGQWRNLQRTFLALVKLQRSTTSTPIPHLGIGVYSSRQSHWRMCHLSSTSAFLTTKFTPSQLALLELSTNLTPYHPTTNHFLVFHSWILFPFLFTYTAPLFFQMIGAVYGMIKREMET